MPRVAPSTTTFTRGHRTGAPTARFGVCLHRAEVLRTGVRILGQIDAASRTDHKLVQLVDHGLCVVTNREIQRDRRALQGKRQKAFSLLAAVLDDAQERGGALSRQQLEELPHGGTTCGIWKDALILREPALPV